MTTIAAILFCALSMFVGSICMTAMGFGSAICYLFIYQIGSMAGLEECCGLPDLKYEVLLLTIGLNTISPILLWVTDIRGNVSWPLALVMVPICLVAVPVGQLLQGYILISGALPSSPGNALNKINDIIPIDNWIEEEALKGTLRLKANGHWIRMPMVNTRGNLTSHTKILDRILNTIPLSKEDQDSMTTTYNLDPNFAVDIPTKEDYKEVEPINFNINCHTDGSKLDDNRTGAGVIINYSHNDIAEEAIHLGNNATVFQAEVFAVGRTAFHLIFAETNNKSVVINCDSQAAIMALDNTKIKSKTTLEAVLALNKLGENNQVLIRWIPAHSGYLGNEKADSLAKRGANNTDATLLKLPIPKVTWDVAIRERTKNNIWTKWRDAPPSHFTRVWRKKFSKSIHNLNRGNLRKATMFLTGHVTLNYHLNKYKPDKISKTCPHCLAAEETTNHYIGQCPKWSAQRSAVFDSFYLSISEVVDDFSIFVIMKYINATGRLNPITEWED